MDDMTKIAEVSSSSSTANVDPAQARRITKILARRSFCVLATTSPTGHSHAAGVVFDWADGAM